MTSTNGEKDSIIDAEPKFERAIIVPLDEAQHFDREGFSGDIFVPKEAAIGFNALQVNVNGQHPRKRMLKGTTRSYYVVEGEGSFSLNGEVRNVDKGDFVVIPPGNEYEYQGTMTLFEFNISPGNSFRDKVILAPKEQAERNPTDHHAANPQRGRLAHAIAEILKRGYTLTTDDLREIMPHYGYSPKSTTMVVHSPNFRKMVAANNVKMIARTYKHHEIYTDLYLPQDETDIADTKAKIEASIKSSIKKRAYSP